MIRKLEGACLAVLVAGGIALTVPADAALPRASPGW